MPPAMTMATRGAVASAPDTVPEASTMAAVLASVFGASARVRAVSRPSKTMMILPREPSA